MKPKLRGNHRTMNPTRGYVGGVLLGIALGSFVLPAISAQGQPIAHSSDAQDILILELQGSVEIMPEGAKFWVLTQTNQVLHPFDRLRTGADSRAALRWSDESVIPVGALTELEILPPYDSNAESGLHLVRGIVSFFHRDKPGRIRVITHGAIAGIEGTEFVLAEDDADANPRTTLSVIDGRVSFSGTNAALGLVFTNGEQAFVEGGGTPVRTAGFIVNNVLQWCLYYPAVLDLRDLPLTSEEEVAFGDSIATYRSGDLLAALASYPASKASDSDAVRVYHAALLLSVGQVEQADSILSTLSAVDGSGRLQRLAHALRRLIAVVKRQSDTSELNPQLSTELLADSYFEQSRAVPGSSLQSALALAREAATNSPEFGFAWERVAELEFCFGRTHSALDALGKSLALAPRNAQALALKGFLLAAQNRTVEATLWFDRALAVDSALGNAWLGRGLCRIRRGDARGGRQDLLIAAALEPQRAALRSYLGKGFGDSGATRRATHELDFAKHLDPADPTAWLYSALLDQQDNRINQGIGDLEESQQLNDNRSVYRSQLLLDQDHAVRSANLAALYRDAGMVDVSVGEAARAVTYDYANDAAHLFLSDSFNALRDPTRFNLRYETVWFNELLLANLFAPVGAGRLSQPVSSQEYSRLFQSDGFGFASSTDVRTDGQTHEVTSLYGARGNSAWSFDLDYQHNDGVRPNNDLSSIDWYTTLKQQVTPQDAAMVLIEYEDYHSGDNFQYYDPSQARPNYRFDEYAQPNVVGFWHHEWAPGIHTLALAGRLVTEQHFSDLATPQLLLIENTPGVVSGTDSNSFDATYNNRIEIYAGELNQVMEWERVTVSVGGRFQSGTFDAQDQLNNPGRLQPLFKPNYVDSSNDRFERVSGYGYLTVEPLDKLWLIGGLAYDKETFPDNFRNPPVASGEDQRSQLGPKAAVVWSPLPEATLRGVYTRSLGGVSLDESYRLEPTQLAGFPQAFRSLISESVVGSLSAPAYTTYGAALDLKLGARTFAELSGQQLEASVRQDIGVFALESFQIPYVPASTPQQLDYRERVLTVSLNRLLADQVVVGAHYNLTQSRLHEVLPAIPVAGADTLETALLHQAGAYLLFNHPSGFFARAEVQWYDQHNSGYTPALGDSDFVQENVFAGWRLARRRLELQLGILNLGGGDYHLNPLNVYSELPRKRVFEARLNFEF
jgi:Flp pilus assembly protein TadD